MPTRRDFLSQTAAASGALRLSMSRPAFGADSKQSPAPRSLNLLILGGTGFIGPHFVRAASERGHKVSVFNRGQSQASLPANVERLIGDRDGDLRAIERRDWDAVIDLSVRLPIWVRTVGEALQQRTRHYTFISSGAVYEHTNAALTRTDEPSKLVKFELEANPYAHSNTDMLMAAKAKYCNTSEPPETCLRKSNQYGTLKVLCEEEAERQFPGATLIARPCYIVGPGDPNVFFTYWLARMERGGAILAPGEPLNPVHFIDARDLAEWVIRMAEQGETGIYNTTGPAHSMGMCEMLGGIRSLFGVPTTLTWVPTSWSQDQDIVDPEAAEWTIWNFSSDDADLAYSSDKAIAKGLTYRPLSVTARDTLAWYKSQPAASRAGVVTQIKVDKLETLQVRRVVTPWEDILRRERNILMRWQAHRASS